MIQNDDHIRRVIKNIAEPKLDRSFLLIGRIHGLSIRLRFPALFHPKWPAIAGGRPLSDIRIELSVMDSYIPDIAN